MGFVIWIIALAAAAIGVLLANLVISLGIIGLTEIISAVIWFLITYICYLGGKRVKDESWFKLISANFFITWIFCTIGALIGEIIWILIQQSSVSINLDVMTNFFFLSLPLTIGPTLAVSLGLRD